MHTSNLCKMLAPNLLRQPPSNAIDISLISCTNTVIETFADNYRTFFEDAVCSLISFYYHHIFIFKMLKINHDDDDDDDDNKWNYYRSFSTHFQNRIRKKISYTAKYDTTNSKSPRCRSPKIRNSFGLLISKAIAWSGTLMYVPFIYSFLLMMIIILICKQTYEVLHKVEVAGKKINTMCGVQEYMWIGGLHFIQIHEAKVIHSPSLLS